MGWVVVDRNDVEYTGTDIAMELNAKNGFSYQGLTELIAGIGAPQAAAYLGEHFASKIAKDILNKAAGYIGLALTAKSVITFVNNSIESAELGEVLEKMKRDGGSVIISNVSYAYYNAHGFYTSFKTETTYTHISIV